MSKENMAVRVLAAIPNDDLYEGVAKSLGMRGMEVDRVMTGSEVLASIASECPDVMLVCDSLPDMPGERAAQEVRNLCDSALIMLSKSTDVDRRAKALEACVDDYVTIPAHNGELYGRIVAVLRRRGGTTRVALTHYDVDGLSLDFQTHIATVHGEVVELTPTEWSILRVLALYRGVPVPSDIIGARVWGAHFSGDGVRLRVHLSNIRKKLERTAAEPRYIVTEPRRGVRLATE